MDPPLDPDLEEFNGHFQRIVASSAPLSSSVSSSSHFVKRSQVPSVKLSFMASKRKVVTLSEKGLIGLFTGLWPSPRSVEVWLNKNWRVLIQGEVQQMFCSKGYFAFIFEKRGSGSYLQKWAIFYRAERDVS